MTRYEFDLPLPPTTSAVVYRALVAGTLAAKYPKVIGLTADAYACRLEFFDAGLKKRDLDAMATSLLEALVKARVLKDDALIETLIISRSSIGPAGTVRVTLLELDTMTKAAVAKSFALEPWADKTLNSYPEGGGAGPGSHLFQNWPNARGAYLQSPSAGSNGLDNASVRPKIARLDIWIQQLRFWMRSTDNTSIAAVKAIRDVPLLAYFDPRFTPDTDLTSDPPGGATFNYTASQTAGAPANWRARNAAGQLLAYLFTSQPAFTPASQVSGTNTAGRTFIEEVWTLLKNELQSGGGIDRWQYVDGVFIDDQNINDLKFRRISDDTAALCDFDDDNVADDEANYAGATSGGQRLLAGIAYNITAARSILGTDKIVMMNCDAPYQQLISSAQPRPLSSTALAGTQDIGIVENILVTNLGMNASGDLLSYYDRSTFYQAVEQSNKLVRDDATSLMGKRVSLLDQEFPTSEGGTPTATVLLAMRLVWGLGMLVEGAIYAGDQGSNKEPAELDECNLKLGDPVSTRTMGTLNDTSNPSSFTVRAADITNGAGQVHYAEFANGLVVVRTDNTGLTPGSSTLGGGTALSFTLPSAGAGFRWDAPNAATYVHPDIPTYAMANQDATLNNGATNVTSVSLKPLHVKALLRVATGGGGGTEVAPAFRSVTSGSTASSGTSLLTLSRPSGVVSGDLLVLALQVTNDTTAGSWGSVTWPAGFTEQAGIGADPSAWNKLHVATKVAGGSEPSTYDVTYGESGGPYRVIGAMIAYQAPNATPIDVAATTQNNPSNAATVVAPSLTPSNANEKRLVTIYGISDGNATTDGRSLAPPGGQTERVEITATATGYSRLMVADEVYASASATGTRSATISGGDCESQAISLMLRGKVP